MKVKERNSQFSSIQFGEFENHLLNIAMNFRQLSNRNSSAYFPFPLYRTIKGKLQISVYVGYFNPPFIPNSQIDCLHRPFDCSNASYLESVREQFLRILRISTKALHCSPVNLIIGQSGNSSMWFKATILQLNCSTNFLDYLMKGQQSLTVDSIIPIPLSNRSFKKTAPNIILLVFLEKRC